MIYELKNLYDVLIDNTDIFKLRNFKEIINIVEKYVGDDWKIYNNNNIDNKEYIRNIIYKNDIFEIVIIIWNKNGSTKIHDHPGECIFKILKGSLLEIKYNYKYDNKCATKIYKEGYISYINNKIGKHKVYNIHDDFSVSLHIYSPPINQYKIDN
jgi:predicted metal-dependent enzyme (double-stranded beta helix superfamily)